MTQAIEAPAKRTATLVVNPSGDAKFKALKEEVAKIGFYIAKATVDSQDAVKRVTEDLALISTLLNTINAERRKHTDPLNDHVHSINDLFRTLSEPLDSAFRTGKAKILAYNKEQERIHLEAELKARAAASAQAALDTVRQVDSASGEITYAPASLPAPVIPEAPPTTVRTGVGTASQRMIPKCKVIDFKQLPDEYKMTNTTLLNRVVADGVRAIPGVEIWLEPSLQIRHR